MINIRYYTSKSINYIVQLKFYNMLFGDISIEDRYNNKIKLNCLISNKKWIYKVKMQKKLKLNQILCLCMLIKDLISFSKLTKI